VIILIYAAVTAGISHTALAALGDSGDRRARWILSRLAIHLCQKVAPKSIVFVHATIAVIGFLTLLGVVFSAW
jgi:hypothetical protein